MAPLAAILTALFLNVAADGNSCVTYDSSNGTYQVDKSGCVKER